MENSKKQTSGRVVAFVLAVDLLAVVGFVLGMPQHVDDPWMGTFLLAMLVALAGATPVRIPALKTSVTATDAFVLTALAAYGPMPACFVAAVGVLSSSLTLQRNRRWMHLAFNAGNVVLSIGLAAQAYRMVGGVAGGPLEAQIWPLLVAATVYFLTNTGLVTAAIVLDSERTFLDTWTETGLWTAVSTYAGLTLAAGLLLALQFVGPSALTLGIPPCWLLAAFYRTHKERQEEQQRRIQHVEDLNLELEDKVAERTVELQGALSHIENANSELRMANERLTEANRSKSEFLANVSHELRTPLNAIIGFSDLLRDRSVGELNHQQVDFIRDIYESGDHLLRLINNILDLSKMEACRMELHTEKIELRRAVRDAVAMVRPQAAGKNLSLDILDSPDVRAGELDPGLFRQVLVNLLSNAVKFTPSGGQVRVIAEREGTDLLLHVEDTGIGIPADQQAKIFTEFYQVDGSYARTYEGTGLGLALVRCMVELHGGKVSLESIPGQGSRFTCRYPGCLIEAEQLVETTAVLPTIDAEAPVRDGRTILVVEDNPMNRKLARNVLRSRGYRVLEATTGEEALQLLQERSPDLVLMDLQLPGMDGLEVTRKLKANPRTADLPVVALTAHARETDEENARQAGCVGYITKPIRLHKFPGQIAAYLSRQGSAV